MLADVAERTAAVLRASVVEVVVEVARLPSYQHTPEVAKQLLVPTVNLPLGTLRDCLHGFVFRLEDRNAAN